MTRLDADGLAFALGVFVLVAVILSLAGLTLRPTNRSLLGAGTVSGVMGYVDVDRRSSDGVALPG